jgi:hypothetical protein
MIDDKKHCSSSDHGTSRLLTLQLPALFLSSLSKVNAEPALVSAFFNTAISTRSSIPTVGSGKNNEYSAEEVMSFHFREYIQY